MCLRKRFRPFGASAVFVVLALATSSPVFAHCDSLDGPVVAAARIALEKGDPAPVLRWVAPEKEAEIRAAFGRTVAVRKLGAEARELADTSFFETLVRVHRAGEGAPYTGLKPAGAPEPAIAKADAALASGTGDELARLIAAHAGEGFKMRYARVVEAKKHADESVAKGREFVSAYVDYVHWVEGVVAAVHRDSEAREGHETPPAPHGH